MRIGFYFKDTSREGSGSYSFQRSIEEALSGSRLEHELFFIYNAKPAGNKAIPSGAYVAFLDDHHRREKITFSVILRKARKLFAIVLFGRTLQGKVQDLVSENERAYENSLNFLCTDLRLDLLWFVSPSFYPVKLPFVFTVWDLQHRMNPVFPEVNYGEWNWTDRETFYQTVLGRAARIITGTEQGKREIRDFYRIPEQNISVIPFCVPSFPSENGIGRDRDVDVADGIRKDDFLFYPAQFWPHKNHILILLALKRLKEEGVGDLQVVFTGNDKGNLAFVKSKVGELGLERSVFFVGFVSADALRWYYSNALALVFPTYFGPDNLPPLEAMSLGCPVLASRVDGADEQLRNAALLFDPGDEMELARCIRRLKEEPSLRADLTAKGRELVEGRRPQDYLDGMAKVLSEMEKMVRCWDSGKRLFYS